MFIPFADYGIVHERTSEFIITPMLAETKLRAGPSVNVLPGVTFEVDKGRGLSGFCDFLIARSPEIYYIQAPIVAVVEAKKEDLIARLGQCVAEMVAIQLFNEREGTPTPAVFRNLRRDMDFLLLSWSRPCGRLHATPVV